VPSPNGGANGVCPPGGTGEPRAHESTPSSRSCPGHASGEPGLSLPAGLSAARAVFVGVFAITWFPGKLISVPGMADKRHIPGELPPQRAAPWLSGWTCRYPLWARQRVRPFRGAGMARETPTAGLRRPRRGRELLSALRAASRSPSAPGVGARRPVNQPDACCRLSRSPCPLPRARGGTPWVGGAGTGTPAQQRSVSRWATARTWI